MLKENMEIAKKINKLIPVIQKFEDVDIVEATDIIKQQTNYKYDTIRELQEQIEFYYKRKKKGEV